MAVCLASAKGATPRPHPRRRDRQDGGSGKLWLQTCRPLRGLAGIFAAPVDSVWSSG